MAPLQTVHIASPSPRDSNASGRIHATGEMADLVRAFDWSTTPLGPISSWTDPLLTIVNTLLASRHPLFLWWGEDLIQFYNDAYRPSLGRGKHPKALGQRGQECWREVWESIGPQIHSVLHGGESTWNVDQYLPIYRNGDQLEDAWWTFSYSPVHDASGHIAGIFVVVAETTQRVLAERELARSRETLHLTVESAGLGTWSYDASTDLSTIDASMQRIFGSPQASGDFAYWITFVHPDDRDHVAAEFNAAISGRAPYESEYRIIRPDGTTRWIRSKGRVLPGTEGPLRLFVVVEDITGRKLAEEALRNSEQRLQLALESANLGTWSFDEETGISTGDPAMQRIFGSDRAAGDFHYWIEFSHPDDREAITADFAAALASDAPYVTEHRIVRPTDGEVRWIRSLGRVLREPGRPLRMFVVVEDITDRKLADIEMQNRARDLRESQRIGKMGSWRLVLATGELTWSEEVYRLMDHDPSLPVINYAERPEVMDPESMRRLDEAVAQCIATGQAYELDTRMYLPSSGKLIWFATRGEPVFDADGNVIELRGTVRDITDRKLAEEALKNSEEHLRLALTTSSDMGTFDWDVPADLLRGDPRFCRIAGVDPEIGRIGAPLADWVEHVLAEDRPILQQAIEESVRTGCDYALDYRFVHASGAIHWVSARGRCIYSDDGTPLRFPGVLLDITQRKLAEQALIRNEKLAAVGRLASSIAHEINNPLESVTNLIYLAKGSPLSPEALEYLSLAERELSRASAITNQTLRFHKQATRPTLVVVDDLIASVLLVHRSRLQNAGVTVHLRKRAHRSVLCFEGEIRQVLGNLIGNAIDSMHPNGGRLLIRTRESHHWKTGRDGLILTFADTGCGISPKTLQNIFEAFFTTKGIAGTGLGLWITREILDRHQGAIFVRSSQLEGRCGTVFAIFLPFETEAR